MKLIDESGTRVDVLSPAKVNLFLHVTGKRSDGYHELNSLMATVGIYDRMIFDFSGSEICVRCDHPHVPEDETNLVVRAARTFRRWLSEKRSDDFSFSPAGISMVIEKKIPVGAGLGGGSSNAATVLLVMNRYYGEPFSREELIDMGVGLGADVPFFIVGGAALAEGIGEKLQPVCGVKPYRLLVVFPGIHVSTAGVFKKLNFKLTKSETPFKNTVFAKENPVSGFDAAEYLENDLEEVAFSLHPAISDVKKKILDLGACGALMSGSGSSVFGLFPGEESALAARDIILRDTDWEAFTAEMPAE